MKLSQLLEKRANLVDQMRSINDNPTGEGGELSESQESQFNEHRSNLEGLDKKIERQQLLDTAERRMEGQQITDQDGDEFEIECRKYSLLKAIAGKAGMNVDFGREQEISRELESRSGTTAEGIMVPLSVFQEPVEQRVLTTTAPAAGPGSNLIATDHLGNQFIDRLRAALIINRLGARVLNGLTGNIDIPKLNGSTTAGFVAENSALSRSDMEFGKVSMTPKHAGALTELSRNMLQQTSPDAESLARQDMAQILAQAVDRVAIQGGGTNEPTGVLATAGIQTFEASAGTGFIETAAEAIGDLDTANVAASRAFLSSYGVKERALKILDADGLPIPISTQFHGERVEFSNLVPIDLGAGSDEHALIYGDWSDLLIGYWSSFDLLVNPYETAAYEKGNVLVRAMLTCDVAVRHPESFVSVTGVTV